MSFGLDTYQLLERIETLKIGAYFQIMRPAAVLAIPLAFAFIFVGVSQVNALQDLSKPLTIGAINELWGTTTFLMLLLGFVALVTGLAGAMIWALRR